MFGIDWNIDWAASGVVLAALVWIRAECIGARQRKDEAARKRREAEIEKQAAQDLEKITNDLLWDVVEQVSRVHVFYPIFLNWTARPQPGKVVGLVNNLPNPRYWRGTNFSATGLMARPTLMTGLSRFYAALIDLERIFEEACRSLDVRGRRQVPMDLAYVAGNVACLDAMHAGEGVLRDHGTDEQRAKVRRPA